MSGDGFDYQGVFKRRKAVFREIGKPTIEIFLIISF